MTAANERTATWASEELSTIASSGDLYVSPFREDGKTFVTPPLIWSVVVDDSLDKFVCRSRNAILRNAHDSEFRVVYSHGSR